MIKILKRIINQHKSNIFRFHNFPNAIITSKKLNNLSFIQYSNIKQSKIFQNEEILTHNNKNNVTINALNKLINNLSDENKIINNEGYLENQFQDFCHVLSNSKDMNNTYDCEVILTKLIYIYMKLRFYHERRILMQVNNSIVNNMNSINKSNHNILTNQKSQISNNQDNFNSSQVSNNYQYRYKLLIKNDSYKDLIKLIHNHVIDLNISLKNSIYIFKTLYFIPQILINNSYNEYGNNISEHIITYIKSNYNEHINPKFLLFLLNKIARDIPNQIDKPALSYCFMLYNHYKDNLFDLTNLINLYYTMINSITYNGETNSEINSDSIKQQINNDLNLVSESKIESSEENIKVCSNDEKSVEDICSNHSNNDKGKINSIKKNIIGNKNNNGISMQKKIRNPNTALKKRIQNMTSLIEQNFISKYKINLNEIYKIENVNSKDKLFYEIILDRIYNIIIEYNKIKHDINQDMIYIYQILYLFKNIAKFYLMNKNFLKIFENQIEKYEHLLNINEKIDVLDNLCKYTNYYPKFCVKFENDIYKHINTLKEAILSSNKFLYPMQQSNILFYDYRLYQYYLNNFFEENQKSNICITDDISQEYQNTCNNNNDYYNGLDSSISKTFKQISFNELITMLWIITKKNQKNSIFLGKFLNDIIKPFMSCVDFGNIIMYLESICLLSIIDEKNSLNYSKDILSNLNILINMLKNTHVMKNFKKSNQHFYPRLYRLLFYLNKKYRLNFMSIDSKILTLLKNSWMNSIRLHMVSPLERKLYTILKKYLLLKNINKSIYTSQLIEIYKVDFFIEPNIIIEYNGEYHFKTNDSHIDNDNAPENNNEDDNKEYNIENTYEGNFLLKLEILKTCGYKVICFDYFEINKIKDNEQLLLDYIDYRLGDILLQRIYQSRNNVHQDITENYSQDIWYQWIVHGYISIFQKFLSNAQQILSLIIINIRKSYISIASNSIRSLYSLYSLNIFCYGSTIKKSKKIIQNKFYSMKERIINSIIDGDSCNLQLRQVNDY